MNDTGVCYECSSECVGAVFCGNGGQDTPDVRLPKTLNIVIECNQQFWGFGGVLFSGDVTYGSSSFDYWDNFDENWLTDKTCNSATIRDLDNEQRPDVSYRSVYDPDSGVVTYDGNTEIDSLGGPAVYLIDRDATKTTDASSCDETDPADVFRHHPENFGFGNKILFEEDIYKNISAAWRGIDSGNPNFVANESGLPDGAVAGPYTGDFETSGILRDSGDPFIHFHVNYTGQPASGIMSGSLLYLKNSNVSQVPDGAYYVAKVEHQPTYTDCMIVGTVGSEEFEADTSGVIWTVANSYDEQTCYGKAAHGVDYTRKKPLAVKNYHTDLGLVINDSRNRIHSNRATRDKWGMTNTRTNDGPRRDYNYVSVQESGHGLLVRTADSDNVALACETGIWNPTWDFIYTSGTTYYSAYEAQDIPDTGLAKDLSDTYGSGTILGTVDINPLPGGWSQYAVSSGMTPLYSKELPFYGPFYEVYDKDNEVRTWQQDNTIKGRNLTCYTKRASLEVYPDCITQEQQYTQCGGGETYLRTNVSRLAFVYRCFDYPEPCAYDESGRPYDGAPSGIDDLRRGLAGQEGYMYLNMGDAWAGEINRDPCGCSDPPPGNLPPNMLTIESPVTFPCFLNFDHDPNSWGAEDQLWKRYAANFLGESIPASSCPSDIEGDYGFAQQPYTTYGFIRNVCGKETNASKAVIQSLNDVNTGNYRETTPNDDTVEPMYWEFPPISPSGGIGGGWGENLTETFVNDSGTYATWGIVDNNNRLVAPYYPVKSGEQLEYCPPNSVAVTFNDFDTQEAFRGNWPKDDVPFLISITHDNNCVGCGTTNMATGDLSVSLQGLDPGFIHNSNNKYGYNHCKVANNPSDTYSIEPEFHCDSGFPSDFCDGVFSYGELVDTNEGLDGNTCECLSVSMTMSGDYWAGTNVPKWFRSEFEPVFSCMFTGIKFLNEWTSLANNGLPIYDEKIPYVGASFGCSDLGIGNALYDARVLADDYLGYNTNPLSYVYDCGACSHSYPGVNGRPDLKLDWWLVREKYQFLFEGLSRDDVYNNQLLLEEGIDVDVGARISSGVFGISTNLGGCTGSTITIYGCQPSGTPAEYGQDGFVVTCPEITCSGESGVWSETFNIYDDSCVNSGCHSTTYTIVDGQLGAREFLNLPPTVCGCVCAGAEAGTAMYRWEWNDASGQYVSTLGGQIMENVHNGDCPPVYWYFSATNIPGFGDLPRMPINDPVAHQVSYNTTDPYCEWKNSADPNYRVDDISHKLIPPGRASDIDFPGGVGDTPCGNLWPEYCDTQWTVCSGDATAFTVNCYHPIYGGTNVTARRKRAYPEIMTVHKIDCLGEGSGYNLHVSREYHTHNRTWKFPLDGYTCDNYYGAIDGGGYNWRRSNNTADTQECPEFYFHPCSGADLNEFAQVWPAVDTGDPNYNLEGPVPSYYLLPHSIPSDQVTPAWPTENNSVSSTGRSLCTQHPHSGSMPNYSVTRDFQHTIKPYQAEYTEWVQLSGSGGSVTAPLYTGVLETPDTGVFGDYCDATVATGDPVSIWLPRGKVYLPSSITDNLESYGQNANVLESGGLSCSGEIWAVSGEPLLKYDNNGTSRFFTQGSLATSQCDLNQRYPDLSGVTLWNYYNLFYGSGEPDSRFFNYVDLIQPDEEGDCNDPGKQPPPWNFNPTQGGPPVSTGDPHFGPLWDSGTDIPLNRKHSCIQDSVACGGELWNNKMFFPRKPYESGTRVTAFGALSICTQDTTYETASWLEGYEDLSANGEVDLLREAKQTRFIDACDLDAHSVTLQTDVGIDDVIIHVDDYLPLLGMYFIDRKMQLGDWTCLQPDSGCYDFLPVHSAQTLETMSFTPSKTWSTNKDVSLGYHLDKLVTTAQDQCLFKPFKVMVDVDCCPDIIRKRGQEGDLYDPTFMQFIDTNVPAGICLNHTNPPLCGCDTSYCNDVEKKFVPDACLTYVAFETAVESTGCSPLHILPSGADPCDFIINSGGNPYGGDIYESPQAIPDCYVFFIDGPPTISQVSAVDVNAVTSGSCFITPDCYPDPGCDPYNSGICYISDGGSGTWDVIDGTVGTVLYSGTVPAAICGNNYYLEGGYENGGTAGTTGCCSFTNDYCSIFGGGTSWYKMTEGDFGSLICDLSSYDVSDTGVIDPNVLATGWKECGCGGGSAGFVSASEVYDTPDCIDNSVVLATITEA